MRSMEIVEHPLFPDGREPELVAMAGDWHGNTGWAMRMVERVAGEVRVILHLGDFGFWKQDPASAKYLRKLTQVLARHGMHLAFVDGNHEWHTGLLERPIDPATGLRPVTERIWHLPRAYRWQWGESTWMAHGGAVSVDRDLRKRGKDWWPEEVLSDEDVQRAITGGPADVMLCHDVPAGVPIDKAGLDGRPLEAVVDSLEHRRLLRWVVDEVRPRHLWHGHFHHRHEFRLDVGWRKDRPGWTGICEVHGLDCDERVPEDNVVLARADGSLVTESRPLI
jgi:hypothetical protein